MRSRTRISSFAAVLAAAFACAASAGSPPAGAWELPPTTLSPYIDGTSGPSLALEADGDAIAVWGSRPDDGIGQNIWTSVRPSGAAWGPRALVWAGAYAVEPVLEADSAGNAVVAWLGDDVDQVENVQVAERAGATGAWGGATDFGSVDAAQFHPRVTINDAGDAMVAWTEGDSTTGETYVRASSRTGAGWSAPVTLSNRANYAIYTDTPVQIELDGSGNAHAMWLAQDITDFSSHVQESRFDGSTWSAPQNVASSANYIQSLEMDGDGMGGIVAAWFVQGQILQAGVFSNGSWTIGDVTDDVAPACGIPGAVSAAPDGSATIAWQAATTRGVSTVAGTSGAWGAATPVNSLPPTTYLNEISLEQVAANQVAAVWTTVDEDQLYGVVGSRRTAAGWQAPTSLAIAGGRGMSRPSVAMDPAGNALAGWAVYQSYWAKIQVTGSPGTTPNVAPAAPTPTPTQGGLRVLNPPFVKVRGGMLRTPRSGRFLRARLVNRDTVPLRGTARLVHFYGRAGKKGSPMRTIAFQRGVRVKVKGRSLLRLRLNAEALRRLRKAPRHSYPARLYLRLRAPDGRTVRTTTTFTLDGWGRFGKGPRPPVARKSC